MVAIARQPINIKDLWHGGVGRYRQWQTRPRVPKPPPLEEVVIYDELHDRIWTAHASFETMGEMLGSTDARSMPEGYPVRVALVLVGATVGGILGILIIWPLLGWIAGIAFGTFFGGIPGAGAGYLIAPKFMPMPFWCVRRFLQEPQTEDDQLTLSCGGALQRQAQH